MRKFTPATQYSRPLKDELLLLRLEMTDSHALSSKVFSLPNLSPGNNPAVGRLKILNFNFNLLLYNGWCIIPWGYHKVNHITQEYLEHQLHGFGSGYIRKSYTRGITVKSGR